jgi:hypothetical protein
MSNNYTMHQQWSTRPDDERFASLTDMLAHLKTEADQCRTLDTDSDMIRVISHSDNDLGVVGKSGNVAYLNNWSMNQLSAAAKSPANYLRQLPSTLAAQCLNHGLSVAPRASHQLYLRQVPANGSPAHLELRALTSPGYSRVLSAHVVDRLRALQANSPAWQAPQVYPRGDFGGSKVPCVGFSGDRDAYVCLQNESVGIADPAAPGEHLTRFILLVNSEVGAKKLDLTLGLCERVCGNFIIWNTKTIAQFSMRHYGDKIRREWHRGIGQIFNDYSALSAREETAKLQAASVKQIAGTKPEVIDALFKREIAGKQQISDAYDMAERHDRNPRTAWGIVHGLTRLSQMSPYADERIDLDRAASRVLDF